MLSGSRSQLTNRWRIAASTAALVLAVLSPADTQSASLQEHSALRVTLISTVVVVPARLSLCQIRNDETNSTRVFRVGDELQGWRIDRISKDQIWLGRGTKLAYLERSRSGEPTAAPVINPHEGQYAHGQ
jgi:hypothetical protein